MSEPVGEDFDKRFLTENIIYKATERHSYGWTNMLSGGGFWVNNEEVHWVDDLLEVREDRALIDFIELVQGDGQ